MHTRYNDDDDGSIYNNNDTGLRGNKVEQGEGMRAGNEATPMAYAYIPHVLRHTQRVQYDNSTYESRHNM
ncbi:hypothetical protein CVT25_012661 [Psilocybe cyanescens]|uniref:Uncharacterized protein n=1 Tax=Psilocybe cyanescens TaxID=93625 RepID=A0A409XLJ2_PSICY|nr:hypothetical protein CVT25_012661 [Psilocybe cyanescens]